MKTLLIFLISFPLLAQEEPVYKRRSLFEVIRKDQNTLTKVQQIPWEESLSFLNRFMFQLEVGNTYARQDLENTDKTSESYANQNQLTINFGFDFYPFQWLSLGYKASRITFKRQRYDGFAVANNEKTQFSHQTYLNLDWGNIFFRYTLLNQKRYWPITNKTNQLTEFAQSTHGPTIGSRIFLSRPLALDLYYFYGLSNSASEINPQSFSFYQIGGKLYWAQRMHFGIEMYEQVSTIEFNSFSSREKIFAVLPYWRF